MSEYQLADIICSEAFNHPFIYPLYNFSFPILISSVLSLLSISVSVNHVIAYYDGNTRQTPNRTKRHLVDYIAE